MTLNEDIQKILEEDVKIKTKNPGILEVPEGKNFWDLPLKHYKELVDKKGYAKVIRALTNLEVWNKNDDPDISKKASKIADDLKKFYKKESLNEEDEICEIVVFGALPTIKEKVIKPFNFINNYEIYTGNKREHDGVLLYIPEDEVVGFEQFLQENNFRYTNKDKLDESLNEEDDSKYINSAISGVLTRKLDDLSNKIDNVKKEIEEVFPDTAVDSKEKVKELREKYAELYSLISNAIKSIEELSNKVK